MFSYWRNGTENRLSEEGVGLCEIKPAAAVLSNVHVVERKSTIHTHWRTLTIDITKIHPTQP